MKVLVTGAAGALGSHVAERLMRDGHSVRALDCFTSYYARTLKEKNAEAVKAAGAEFLECDLAVDDLTPAMRGIDMVFHFAGQPGISAATGFDTYVRNNIVATERLLGASENAGVHAGFINIATSSVYGDHADRDETAEPKPNSYYGVTKLAAEQLALARWRATSFPATSLRIFSVYGERERPDKLYHALARAIFEEKEFKLHEGSRDHVRSFTYVGDVVDGCMLAMNAMDLCRGEIFNIGSDTTHTTGEGIDLIEELTGKKARFVQVPPRPGDQVVTKADITKARRVLGYNPSMSLREGLAREVAWVRESIGL